MIVDDHQDNLMMLGETFIRQLQCEVCTANSVDEAEVLLRRQRFHVIVSDFDMPEKDGAELAKILAGLPCEAPLLFYTGRDRPRDFWAKLDYPCHAVIKPNLNDLLEIASNFLNN